MHWLVDHARLVYLLLGLVALGFLAAFWLQRRVQLLAYVAAVLVVIGLFALLTQAVVTDRQRIEANVRAMAAGIVEGRVGKVMPFVARDFNAQGLDRQRVEAGLNVAVERYRPSDIVVWGYETTELIEGKSAKVGFNCRASGPFGEAIYYFRCDFVRENEVWKMRSFEAFNPIIDQKTPLPIR